MPSDVSRLVALAERALRSVTDAPWEINTEGWAVISSGSDSVLHGYYESECPSCGAEISDTACVAISLEDAEFIASARQLIPELIAEVERQHREACQLECELNGTPEDGSPTHAYGLK